MQDQPPFIVGQILALFLVCIYLYYHFLFSERGDSPITSNEFRIELGIIKDRPIIDEAFYKDCVDCLIALGFNKNKSKIITNKVFELHVPKNIESFIGLAMNYK
jgi:hypothetical protein